MKRDPVLAQLDFLINGPPKTPRAEEPPPPPPPPPVQPPPPPLLAPNPVLAQLDALINGAPAAAVAAEAVEEEEPRGPPGILREFGGVKGWMARHGNPMCTTPRSPGVCQEEDATSDVCKNMPLSDQTSCCGSR